MTTSNWSYFGATTDGDEFLIHGLNMWDHTWHPTGETAHVKDPLWNGEFTFPVYQIRTETQTITFATGEFSNTIWGIFVPTQDLPQNHKPAPLFPQKK